MQQIICLLFYDFQYLHDFCNYVYLQLCKYQLN